MAELPLCHRFHGHKLLFSQHCMEIRQICQSSMKYNENPGVLLTSFLQTVLCRKITIIIFKKDQKSPSWGWTPHAQIPPSAFPNQSWKKTKNHWISQVNQVSFWHTSFIFLSILSPGDPKMGLNTAINKRIADGHKICGFSPDLNSGLDRPTFVY